MNLDARIPPIIATFPVYHGNRAFEFTMPKDNLKSGEYRRFAIRERNEVLSWQME